MRVVHFSQMAPNHSGLYESTKDQIKYERLNGIDSQIVDPFDKDAPVKKDDWLKATHWEKAKEFDIWVVHAGLPPPLKEYIKENFVKHGMVSILHGPVEHMLFKEHSRALDINYSERSFTETHINMIWHYDRCVVINQHEYDISKLYDENGSLVYIPNSIDLERIEERTDWPYTKRPAIISADYPRFEKNMAHMIWAMPSIIEKLPDARLSVLALPFENIDFWRNIYHRSKNWHLLRKCTDNLHIKGGPVMPYMYGADMMFNSNFTGIASRVHMEAMAIGVPVIAYNGEYTKYHAKAFDIHSIADTVVQCWEDLNSTDLRDQVRKYAYENYDRKKYVPEYIKLYQEVLREKNIG